MIDLEQHGAVWVLAMRNGENRFNRESIDALHAALDRIEAVEGPVALVTTGEGKFYSNGLDLDWLMSAGAFAGGAMLACAHDIAVMREDRGYWCLPEVDLGLPLSPAMYAVVAAHIPEPTLRQALISGRRYAAAEARAAGLVTEVAAESLVLERAIALASELAAKNRDVIGAHKRLMYGDALRLCGVEVANAGLSSTISPS
jgi:Delta3-Delta2-enoyl-CoA isomerase